MTGQHPPPPPPRDMSMYIDEKKQYKVQIVKLDYPLILRVLNFTWGMPQREFAFLLPLLPLHPEAIMHRPVRWLAWQNKGR